MTRQPLGIRLLVHTLLLLGMGLTLAPYAWMVSSSFKSHTDIFSATLELIPRRLIVDNYVVAVTREPTLRAIGNSLIMAAAETVAVVDRRARADQRRRLEAAGGPTAVLAEGVKIPYTPAPAEFEPAPVEARERSRRPAPLDATPGGE